MNITRDQKIAGVSAMALRKLFRGADRIHARHVVEDLGIEQRAAQKLLGTLVKLGYLTRAGRAEHDIGYFDLTLEAGQLGNASAAKPFTRAAADRAVAAFLDRCRAVDADPYWLYRVKRVQIFGSYLTEKERVGDVDVTLDLAPKERNRAKHNELTCERTRLVASKGRYFRNLIDELCWSEIEVTNFIKGGSRVIKLHSSMDGIFTKTKVKVKKVYP